MDKDMNSQDELLLKTHRQTLEAHPHFLAVSQDEARRLLLTYYRNPRHQKNYFAIFHHSAHATYLFELSWIDIAKSIIRTIEVHISTDIHEPWRYFHPSSLISSSGIPYLDAYDTKTLDALEVLLRELNQTPMIFLPKNELQPNQTVDKLPDEIENHQCYFKFTREESEAFLKTFPKNQQLVIFRESTQPGKITATIPNSDGTIGHQLISYKLQPETCGHEMECVFSKGDDFKTPLSFSELNVDFKRRGYTVLNRSDHLKLRTNAEKNAQPVSQAALAVNFSGINLASAASPQPQPNTNVSAQPKPNQNAQYRFGSN